MRSLALSPDEYISELTEDRKHMVSEIRDTIIKNLPEGFEETMSYGMIGYVVPKSIYPSGYHANPKEPLPFMSLASQKNYVALYHMAIYSDMNMLTWFQEEYIKIHGKKPDMGKSCIRLRKLDEKTLHLIGLMASKITVEEYVKRYEAVKK